MPTAFFQDVLADSEEISPEDEDAWYILRLDGGLYTLQTVDYILAWIAMEDDGVCLISHVIRLSLLILASLRSSYIYHRCSVGKISH